MTPGETEARDVTPGEREAKDVTPEETEARDVTPEERDIASRVEELVGAVLGRSMREAEVATLRLRDLGLSSLRMIRLLADLEGAFGMRIRDEQVNGENFGTLQRLIRFVEQQAGNGS
jgi:acyl carrier protein